MFPNKLSSIFSGDVFLPQVEKIFGPDRSKHIVIIDDFFPHPLSAFRYAEHGKLLKAFPNLEVYSHGGSLFFANETRTLEELIEDYARAEPTSMRRVKRLTETNFPAADAYYTIFIKNAFDFIDKIEQVSSPLALTLYPGGGFQIDDPHSDRMLERVLSSPQLKKVIATQKITLEYLLDKKFCGEDQISFIYGGIPGPVGPAPASGRRRFGFEKKRFDVAFTAGRYSEKGEEKGYDVFVEAAKILAKSFDDIHFHVVGNYDETIIDVTDLAGKITFYGAQQTKFFDRFYSAVDVFLSPNKPSKVAPGAFDGFPTAAASEAVLRGVALVCSDPLNLNVKFRDGHDIVIVPSDGQAVAAAVRRLIDDPKGLDRLARRGQAAFKKVSGYTGQMKPRIDILTALTNERPNP